jgi:hypothetical protein
LPVTPTFPLFNCSKLAHSLIPCRAYAHLDQSARRPNGISSRCKAR